AVGIDLDTELVVRAENAGVHHAYQRAQINPTDLPPAVASCDAIIITAATGSDDPVRLAGALARDRARIVVVGDVGMTLPRAPYYGKELELRLSRSYGPGRYDREYEERGLDYPIGYVRWTERRNMAAFVELLASGRVDVAPLIRRRVQIAEADAAYEELLAGSSPLGIVIEYPEREPAP